MTNAYFAFLPLINFFSFIRLNIKRFDVEDLNMHKQAPHRHKKGSG
ncbi:hypothetical protein VCHA47P369_20122 [Vibrio chagasii]|nr:hypothetical protein VCHA27O13_90118 [Vibrio chagasii]CAH6816073.1 hypothetical protein VCHA36P164_130061 [Vibrio chagasii]CAH6835476.1 hypothetical protein VCHA35O137_10123 [Vibrio chagasii]CAH6892621.1 hypothetical protein VCHA54P489_100048 [Vibrio chagasii]CAH6900102.1 hypothetical protein VCHA40P242_110046 [Vibrio chagasii]